LGEEGSEFFPALFFAKKKEKKERTKEKTWLWFHWEALWEETELGDLRKMDLLTWSMMRT